MDALQRKQAKIERIQKVAEDLEREHENRREERLELAIIKMRGFKWKQQAQEKFNHLKPLMPSGAFLNFRKDGSTEYYLFGSPQPPEIEHYLDEQAKKIKYKTSLIKGDYLPQSSFIWELISDKSIGKLCVEKRGIGHWTIADNGLIEARVLLTRKEYGELEIYGRNKEIRTMYLIRTMYFKEGRHQKINLIGELSESSPSSITRGILGSLGSLGSLAEEPDFDTEHFRIKQARLSFQEKEEFNIPLSQRKNGVILVNTKECNPVLSGKYYYRRQNENYEIFEFKERKVSGLVVEDHLRIPLFGEVYWRLFAKGQTKLNARVGHWKYSEADLIEVTFPSFDKNLGNLAQNLKPTPVTLYFKIDHQKNIVLVGREVNETREMFPENRWVKLQLQ